MNYLEKNRQCIKDLRPLLHQYLENYTSEQQKNITVSSQASRDGNQYMTIVRDTMSVRLNSAYRPLEEAARWANQYEFSNLSIVVVMFGIGNAYCLRELVKKLRDGDHIIAVEPCYDVFLHAITEYDLSDILMDTRVSIVISENDSSVFVRALNTYIDWMNIKSEIVCVHPQYEKCFPNELQDFYQKVKDFNSKTFVNRNTEAYFAKDIVKNTISNMKFIPGSNYLMELNGLIPQEATAIIVAAGPSLDKNIDLLQKAKGKAIIIATDTALRYLYRKGIEADFAVSIDPRKPENYFDNCGFEQMPFFINGEVNRNVLNKHHGKKVWIMEHPFIDRFYKQKGHKVTEYSCGGSVACAAFMISVALKFQRIVFVGQDLAYQGNVTHAGGEVCEILNEEQGIRYVEGIDGKPVKTRNDWYIYLKWFEDAIEGLKGKVQCIDATEGGAKIAGTEIMTLQEVIDKYCTVSVDAAKIINQMQPTFNQKDLDDFTEFLDQAVTDLSMIEKESATILNLCREILYELKDPVRGAKRISQLSAQIAEKNLRISKVPVFCLVDAILRQKTMDEIQNMGQFEKDEDSNKVKTFEYTKRIIEASKETSKELYPQLKQAVGDYKERMEGLNAQ